MTPTRLQRAPKTLSRERPVPLDPLALASTWRGDDPRAAVTPYDDIWFLLRPQLP
jgi:hypothetical protein